MTTVGLDVGKRHIHFSVCKDFKIVQRGREQSMKRLIAALPPPPCLVVFEACRAGWKIHRELAAAGYQATMLDTTRVRELGVGRRGKKNDTVDADRLAEAAYRGPVPVAHLLSPARQELRGWLTVRANIVKTRANCVIAAKGMLLGERIDERAGVERFPEAVRKREDLKEPLREQLEPLLEVIQTSTTQLIALDERIEKLAKEDQVATLLMTCPGVGVVTATMFIAVIDDAGRFESKAQVACYLGLVPEEDSSGDRSRLGHITKAGNAAMRTLLVESAHTIMNTKTLADDPLHRWGQMVEARRGNRQIAAVALARKLALVLFTMWRRNEPYDPKRQLREMAKGIEADAMAKLAAAEGMRKVDKKLRERSSKRRRAKKSHDKAEELRVAKTAPTEKAPMEKAPMEKAPMEKTSTEKAPMEKAPMEKAPMEKAPMEKTATEKKTRTVKKATAERKTSRAMKLPTVELHPASQPVHEM